VASILASANPARPASAVTGIVPAGLLYLDRPLADATVVGDPVGLHEQAAAGREALAERAHPAERVLDAMQDPEAEDHVETLAGVLERDRVAAHLLHSRANHGRAPPPATGRATPASPPRPPPDRGRGADLRPA
jgi:hypothetical protein